MTTKRAALFLRVSTEEQELANQAAPLRALAKSRSFRIVRTFEEVASTKHSRTRPVLKAMLRAAREKSFDVIVVWAIDRLGRSMAGNLDMILELDRLGVQVVSLQEPWLDTNSPVRSLLVAIFSWVAEQERERLAQRVRAGMKRAHAAGVVLGRVRQSDYDLELAVAMVQRGVPLREASRELGVPLTSLHRAVTRGNPPSAGH